MNEPDKFPALLHWTVRRRIAIEALAPLKTERGRNSGKIYLFLPNLCPVHLT